MNTKFLRVFIFIISISLTNITKAMHTNDSIKKTVSSLSYLHALQAHFPKSLNISFEENNEEVSHRISGFIQGSKQKLLQFSNMNRLTQKNKPSETRNKKLSDHFIKALIVPTSDGHQISFSVSGQTKDEQYTDYLKLSKRRGSFEPSAYSGKLTRIRKASLHPNLNCIVYNPETYILDQAAAKHYWQVANHHIKKRKKDKKNSSSSKVNNTIIIS